MLSGDVMRRFVFFFAAVSLALDGSARAAGTANLTVVQPTGPVPAGSACIGSHPAIVISVKNTGSVASAAIASPDGAGISGGPIAGYAGLPAIAPGATATVSFTIISTRVSMSPPKRADKLITLNVKFDPKHKAGLSTNATDIPAVLTSETCTGPEESSASPSPSPSPTASPSGQVSSRRFSSPGPTTVQPTVVPIVAPILGGVIQNPNPFKGVDLRPPAPQFPRQPTSLQDCRDHGGLLASVLCLGAYEPGGSGLILVWDGYNAKISGFRVYSTTGGRKPISPQLAATGNATTFAFIAGRSNSFTGQCYVVTAYVGFNESADSRPYCVTKTVAANVTTLSPDHIGSYTASHGGNTGVFGNALEQLLDPAGLFSSVLHPNKDGWVDGTASAGYEHRTQKGTFGDSFYNMYARGAAHFNTAAFDNRDVMSAHLNYSVNYAYTGRGNSPQKSQESCTAKVAPATQLWWDFTGNQGLAPINGGESIVAPNNQSVSLDVTKIVGGWAGGGTNDGFTFIGGDENLNAFYESSCLSKYQSVSLTVTYF